jgi:glycolate oxidase
VKYGVTRDHVLGLEVVLADGTVLETGRRTIKGVAGLDLTSLFVGSEGTLGIVTRARLRLRPVPPPASTLVAFFGTLGAAGRAVVDLVRGGTDLSLLEILDRTTIEAVEGWRRMDLDTEAAALLLVQVDAPAPAGASVIQRAAATCEAAGATDTALTDDPVEGEALLEARRLAYPALERLGATLLDDVAVPRSRIPDLIDGIEAIAGRRGVTIGTFGHAGDGNLHPTVVVPHGDEEARVRGLAAFGDVVRTALDLGGTITGEHGVGALKRDWLEREVGTECLRIQRAVKATLDPAGLLNPGRSL